jgi:hypothetical protein
LRWSAGRRGTGVFGRAGRAAPTSSSERARNTCLPDPNP